MTVSTITELGHDPITTVSVLFLSFQVPSPEIGWLVLLLIGVGLPFLCWLLYLWVRSDIEVEGRRDPVAGQDGPVADYLERLDQGLRLPAGLRRDVVAEIAGHLSQSVAALESDGATHADAVREALRRLGPPEPLARDLRSAQQTTRRLLAGVGGGVFGATSGFMLGLLYAFLALLPSLALMLLLAMGLERLAPGSTARFGRAFDVLGSLFVPLADLVTGRVTTRLAAGFARRDVRQVGWVVAMIGCPIVAVLVVAGWESSWTWVAVPGALATPIAFGGGALTGDRAVRFPVRRDRIVIWIALTLAAFAIAFLLDLRAERAASPSDQAALLPAMAPAELLPSDAHPTQGMWGSCRASEPPRLDCRFSGSLRAGWSDLRVEAWPARPLDPERVVPGVTRPTAIGPVTLRVDEVLATVDPGFHRSGNAWLAVLTGVGPDGMRYRLTNGASDTFDWRPTLLEWLAAPD